jgi:Calcineurin-like phosphoesterase
MPAAQRVPLIVTYRALDGLLNTRPESVAEETRRAVSSTTSDPVEAAMILVSFTAALERLKNSEQIPGVLVSPDDRMASLLQSFMAERAIEQGLERKALESGGEEARYDSKDWVGWAKSFFTWRQKIISHDWIWPSPTPEPIANVFRVAVLGDWGTGLYGAPYCAESIRRDSFGYDLILHLGDVYYSGTKREVAEQFLEIWPVNESRRSLNRALNSNHEMYTGGHAYFEQTLKKFGQSSSCFAFQNDHWVLVGLDSAYQEHDLANDQETWLADIVEKAAGRKIVLFSHHQPFSRMEKQGPKLQTKLGPLLTAKKISAWYWGHEHRCMLYQQHPAWGLYGRTVGHSGYPYFRDNLRNVPAERVGNGSLWRWLHPQNLLPGGFILDGTNPYVKGHENEYGPNGYMTLEFSDAQLNEIVHEADGTPIYQRPLV